MCWANFRAGVSPKLWAKLWDKCRSRLEPKFWLNFWLKFWLKFWPRFRQHAGAVALRQRRHALIRRHHGYPVDALRPDQRRQNILQHGEHQPLPRRIGQYRRQTALGMGQHLHGNDGARRAGAHGEALKLVDCLSLSRPQKVMHCCARAILSSSERIMVLVTRTSRCTASCKA